MTMVGRPRSVDTFKVVGGTSSRQTLGIQRVRMRRPHHRLWALSAIVALGLGLFPVRKPAQ